MIKILFSLIALQFLLTGCTGVNTYPNVARAGDTVSLAMGWQKHFKRSNTTVTITPSIGADIVYLPDDPALKAIINFYPDPVSNLVVGTKVNSDTFFHFGNTYGSLINVGTGGDLDWWQTVAFVNLPPAIAIGGANINLTNDVGDTINTAVNIVEGVGTEELFTTISSGPLNAEQLASMERTTNFEVSINSAVIPYAVEMEFLHVDPVTVINPNVLKNVTWTSDGTSLKVMILPSSPVALTNLHDLKFYVAGFIPFSWVAGVPVLTLQSITAFDINGDVVPGVSASLVADIRI